MQAKKLSDVKNNLSRYVERVRHGERIRIFVHGVPVADLVPVSNIESEDEVGQPRLLELERRGLLRRGSGELPAELLELGPTASGQPLSGYLLEEREEGR